MYGWRARVGNISPTACAEILPYEFYRVAPEGVTFMSTNLVIRKIRGQDSEDSDFHIMTVCPSRYTSGKSSRVISVLDTKRESFLV